MVQSSLLVSHYTKQFTCRLVFLSGFFIAILLLMAPVAFGFAGGDGSEEYPFLIATAEHLDAVRDHLGAHFLQTADIDLGVAPWDEGEGWQPIGLIPDDDDSWNSFDGTFDGNGYAILSLTINSQRDWDETGGLFFSIGSSGVVANVQLTGGTVGGAPDVAALTVAPLAGSNRGLIINCHSSCNVVNAYEGGGGLAGHNTGIIRNSSASGAVAAAFGAGGLVGSNYGLIEDSRATGPVEAEFHTVGGLVSMNGWESTIRRSYASGPVSVMGDNPGFYEAGGLAGANDGIIEESYATGNVVGSGSDIGGLVGANSGIVFDSYATGHVIGQERVGGLAGSNAGQIRNAYSTGAVTADEDLGGLIGFMSSGSVSNCYWNTNTSGRATSAGGEGRTTEEMTYPHAANTYADWDFEEVWAEDAEGNANNGYPYLRGRAPLPGEFAGGSGSEEEPFLVETAEHLNNVRHHPDAHFLQIADIDLGVAPWDHGAGWAPLGKYDWEAGMEGFAGVYDGGRFKILSLTIDHDLAGDDGGWGHGPSGGLFDRISGSGVVRNVTLEGGQVQGGFMAIAPLAGNNSGVIENCHASTDVMGAYEAVGGLVGENYGTIRDSSAAGSVSGGAFVGGLVGYNHHLIEDSHASGAVGAEYHGAGGLVGDNLDGVIRRSYATGPVSALGDDPDFFDVGGLLGANFGTVEESYATGSVTGRGQNAGGLAGQNRRLIRDSFATGNVLGEENVGGLVGTNHRERDWDTSEPIDGTGLIEHSYSIGFVEGISGVGGLIGTNDGDVTGSYWNFDTSGQTESAGGEGRATADMTYPHDPDTYVDWDFAAIWAADTAGGVNNGYPWLRMPGDGPAPVRFEEWAEAIPDPALRGDLDAPAGDNIPNLLKFASGLDPMTPYSPRDVMTIYVPGDAPAPMFVVLGDAPDEGSSSLPFAIVFYRSKTAAGVDIFSEHATDLVDEDWGPDGITEEIIAEDSERETWKATAPVAEGGFMRLKVERGE